MKITPTDLLTPIYLKTSAEMPWPDQEGAFYILSRDGLHLCRNQPHFRSSVPAPNWPSELSTHPTFLSLLHPKIPRAPLELMVGFFHRLASLHGAEAAALLVLDRATGRVRFHVPEQTARVGADSRGRRYPIGVSYETEPAPPPGCLVVGDIHSHAFAAAYASAVDQHDEAHRPGLHLVVGRIDWEPPEFHCEFVVDGTRFPVQEETILDGYTKRRHDVPRSWIRRVRVELAGPVEDYWDRSGYGRKEKPKMMDFPAAADRGGIQ